MIKSLLVGFLSLLLPSGGADASDAVWSAMRQPGAIALMRHAYAPGYSDPENFRLDDCSTQRNLSDQGRQQAQKIGEAFKANGVDVDRVFASQWCRSFETAELLGLGPVEELPSLNSFFEARNRSAQQTQSVLSFLGQLDGSVTSVLVTHQVNITALTGRPTASGEFIVARLAEDGELKVIGEIAIPY